MSKIREAILTSCTSRPSKVAMIVARCSDVLGDDSKIMLETIGREIEMLVADGALEATGNSDDWRRSEVRLAQS